MKQNNPIQTRADQMLLKWALAINTPKVKVVRILSEKEDSDMLDAYYQYMLAVDSDQEDFVMILTTPFSNKKTYSKALLEEIEEEINHWNTAEIPESFNFETITWKPDYTLGSTKNHAQLFIQNLNDFANYFQPDKKIKIGFVLRTGEISKGDALAWFSQLLQNQMEPHLTIGVDDTANNPVFDDLAKRYPEEVYTIVPEFNMGAAMEQMAALGNPTETDTSYRANLMRLINGVKKRKGKKVQQAAKTCLDIAAKAVKKDANWLTQVVTIYTMLYTDQIGYKNYDDALYFADKAVEAALFSKDLIKAEVSFRLIGQTHLGRGGLQQLKKKKEKALSDYLLAANAYEKAGDYLMQCESLRLSGWIANKSARKEEAVEHYLKAYDLKDKLDEVHIKSSTYPLVVQNLSNSIKRRNYLSDSQMDEDMKPYFGENWKEHIEKFGKFNKETNTIYQ